jgi:hypothetical protein
MLQPSATTSTARLVELTAVSTRGYFRFVRAHGNCAKVIESARTCDASTPPLEGEKIPTSQAVDRVFLSKLSKKKLLDLLQFQIRNIWRVDGFYFLGIEREFGTEAASKIDEECWKTMGTLEARQLKEVVQAREWSVPKIIKALRLTSWALDHEEYKEVEVRRDRGLFRVVNRRTQLTRIRKGLTEFPCRPIRESYLKAFVRELNPGIVVACKICPPGPHPENAWCEWEFSRSA